MNQLKILEYNPDLKEHFYTINEEWISAMFSMEPIDEDILKNPEENILDGGGFIFFVEHEKLGVVGTCALKKNNEGEFELTKMGVLEKARGLKVGEFLLKFVIEFAQSQKFSEVYLLTNSDCKAAIHLYEKNGFVHDKEILQRFGSSYQRANVAMRLG